MLLEGKHIWTRWTHSSEKHSSKLTAALQKDGYTCFFTLLLTPPHPPPKKKIFKESFLWHSLVSCDHVDKNFSELQQQPPNLLKHPVSEVKLHPWLRYLSNYSNISSMVRQIFSSLLKTSCLATRMCAAQPSCLKSSSHAVLSDVLQGFHSSIHPWLLPSPSCTDYRTENKKQNRKVQYVLPIKHLFFKRTEMFKQQNTMSKILTSYNV